MRTKRKTAPAPEGYLTQSEVVKMLSPFLSQSFHVAQERNAGRLGLFGEGWIIVGIRHYYREVEVKALLDRFMSSDSKTRLVPVRHEKEAA